MEAVECLHRSSPQHAHVARGGRVVKVLVLLSMVVDVALSPSREVVMVDGSRFVCLIVARSCVFVRTLSHPSSAPPSAGCLLPVC